MLLGPVVLALSALAACAGGGGSSSVPPFNAGTATPTAPPSVPTLAPATAATTVPLSSSTAQPQAVAIPPAAGLSGSITLPAATIPAGTSLDVTTTTTTPGGVTPLAFGRSPQSVRAARSSGLEVLYYQGLRFTQTLTFPGYPAFTIGLPAGYDPSKGVFELAFYDGLGWTYPVGGPGTASGQQISFPSAPGPVTYQANQSYYFALYYAPAPPAPTPTPTASPSPTPSPSPTASPTSSPSPSPTPSPTPTPGPLTASPSSLSFLGTGSDLMQTVTVSSTYFTGTFAASACTNAQNTTVATVGAVDANGTFTVTPVAAGACTITVTDSSNRTATVSVTVATSSLHVQGKKNR
ncbi:MAG TPA: hypothetical protein VK669_07540 [Candidatus Limnocylindrales bacterium]|nr:hypothetical protein [Candidatus Limnocylindrales bacterium]